MRQIKRRGTNTQMDPNRFPCTVLPRAKKNNEKQDSKNHQPRTTRYPLIKTEIQHGNQQLNTWYLAKIISHRRAWQLVTPKEKSL